MATVTTQVRVDEKIKKQETIPQYRPEVIDAMEKARKLSKNPKTKRYCNFSAALENIG